MTRQDRVSLQRVTAQTPPESQNEQVIGLRAFVVSRSFDVVLAVLGLAYTQIRIITEPGGWPEAPVVLVAFVALSPALIAFRRVEPVIAALGLLVGAFGWAILGQTGWVQLAGCALALWALPGRRPPIRVFGTALAVAALPMIADTQWSNLVSWIYPRADQRATSHDFSLDELPWFTEGQYDRILQSGWPWWQSVALLLVGLLGVAYWLQQRAPAYQSNRLDELKAFLAENSRSLDVLLAVAASSAVLVEFCRDLAHGNWWTAPGWMPYAIAYSGLILVLRRRWPALVVGVLAVGALVAYWQTSTSWSVLAVFAIALYTLAATRPLRISLPVATVPLVLVPVLAALIRYPQMVWVFPELKEQPLVGDFGSQFHNLEYEAIVDRQYPASLSMIMALAVCVGVLAKFYRRNREAAAREAELERLTQEQDAAQVVLTERSHIARDLHDVVAHAVNLMVIQAETGPDLIRRGDRDVLEGFQRIGDAGRRALGELDRLLSALRDADGVPDPQLAPQPGLAQLRQLAKDVSHEWLTVELELDGDPHRPPAGHQLTAYRLVQEALTNVARHAGAQTAKVAVKISDDGIAVEVSDDGTGFDLAAAGTRGRHGLAGMRERVRIHHGTLEVKTAPGAGTVVAAWIPVAQGRLARVGHE